MRIIVYIFTCLISINVSAENSFDTIGNGLFQFSSSDGVIVKTNYIGWSENWRWDEPVLKSKIDDQHNKKYTLNFNGQNVRSSIDLSIKNTTFTYDFSHYFNKSIPKTIGGGIEFNLNVESQIRNHSAKEPKLLKNNTGWIWEFEPNKFIKVTFPEGTASVDFEDKSRIRTFFFHNSIKRGTGKTRMVIHTPGDTYYESPDMQRTTDYTKWYKDQLNPHQSFIDLSYLNEKPAGTHGFLKSVNDQFVFEDGTPVKFFGTNVQAYSLFVKDKRLIKRHAKRLAKLGFNLVRLHHHDSVWVEPSLIAKTHTTQEIDNGALDTYFWWIKCLRDEGIYVYVDLQVLRPWRAGDRVPGWETDLERNAQNGMEVAKGFIYLNKRMQELSKKFNEELLTRVNPYTKLAIKDDPAVMGVMITNENDITFHFGYSFLPDKNHPYHQSLFEKEIAIFSRKTGFNVDKIHQLWAPGPSKYFLNDLEARFNLDMINHLRKLGVKVPIATTSLWGDESLFSLPALTTGDMVDAHGYGRDDIFEKSELKKNPHQVPNFLHWIGQGQVYNKPYTVTEYNVEDGYDNKNAFIPIISVSSMATFQGWDAIMLYGYSQDGLTGNSTSTWDSYTHPVIMGVVPAMALLYREGHIAKARKTLVLSPDIDTLLGKDLSPNTSVALRSIMEKHRMVIAMPKSANLPWLKPTKLDNNQTLINNFSTNVLEQNKNTITSDTGELTRNWRKGIMTINSPKSQLIMGKIEGAKINLKDVSVKAKTTDAAIIFTSLDKQPINASSSILLSAVSRIKKVKKQWQGSFYSEPVAADIILSSSQKGLHLVKIHANGDEGKKIPLKRDKNGKYSFSISAQDKTHWYKITK